MATGCHARRNGCFGETDGTGHHVGQWVDEDLQDHVPWDRGVWVDALGTVIAIWTDDEAVVRLNEARFVYKRISVGSPGGGNLRDDAPSLFRGRGLDGCAREWRSYAGPSAQ
jgi:hypothetical protein